jgi:predicted DNA-binding transcriptional regulator YafY
MPKSENQKLKLLYLRKLLLDKTDENHAITTPEFIKALEKMGIDSERKSIYDDIKCLQQYGDDTGEFQLESEKVGHSNASYISEREFELAELKLLVDAVQSSKFITQKRSKDLISKIEKLTNVHEASELHRQVYVAGRIKSINKSVYYSVDNIHKAICNNKKLSFGYYKWKLSAKKKIEFKKEEKNYCVSPWALVWDDEKYYMIGYDSESETLKHYRVDKMNETQLVDEDREGKKSFGDENMATYTNSHFGMFSGKKELVSIEFDNELANVVADRFGKNVRIIKSDEAHFVVNVEVVVSDTFFGWLLSLNKGVRVVSPESVVDKMRDKVSKLVELYEL